MINIYIYLHEGMKVESMSNKDPKSLTMEIKPPIHTQCDKALDEQIIVVEAVLEESMRWSDRGGL